MPYQSCHAPDIGTRGPLHLKSYLWSAVPGGLDATPVTTPYTRLSKVTENRTAPKITLGKPQLAGAVNCAAFVDDFTRRRIFCLCFFEIVENGLVLDGEHDVGGVDVLNHFGER